jgi:TRAP-type C4-dicarboxylate transport system permease small subunit
MTQPDPTPPQASSASLAEQVGQLNQAMELADPDLGASSLDRGINQIVEFIGIAVLATIAVLVFANAVGRYAFTSPIIWAEEIVISLIPWLAMTGIFLSVRRRQFIRLGSYTLGLPPIVRITIDLFIQVLSAATFVVVAFYSFEYFSLFGGDVTTYVNIPTGWFTSAMFIGAAGVALAFLVNAWRERRDRRAISAVRSE